MKVSEWCSEVRLIVLGTDSFNHNMRDWFIFSQIYTLLSNDFQELSVFFNTDYGFQPNYSAMDFEYTTFHSADKTINKVLDKIIKNVQIGYSKDSDGNYSASDKNKMADTISVNWQWIAQMILSKFGEKWNRLVIAFYNETYNPIHNYDMTESIETESSGTTIPNLITSSTSKTNTDIITKTSSDNNRYGFNSSSAVPTDTDNSTQTMIGDSDNNTTDSTTTQTGNTSISDKGTSKTTRSGNIGVTTTQKMLNEEWEVRKHNIIEMMFEDVDSVLCSHIYEP